MPAMWEDFVCEIGPAPGTGTVTLAGANPDIPCMTFLVAGYHTGDWIYYVITDGAAGGLSEQVMGQFNATAGTLSRATTIKTNAGGTTPLNFTTSVKVFACPPASRIAYYDIATNLRPLADVAILNGRAYYGKDTGGTDRALLTLAPDNYVDMFVAGGAGSKWRVLNQTGTVELLGVENSGNVFIAGIIDASSTIRMLNNQVLQAKDTGGTFRNLLMLDTSNDVTHFVAAGGSTLWRIVNQAFSQTLFSVSNSGAGTLLGTLTSAGISTTTLGTTNATITTLGVIGASTLAGLVTSNVGYAGKAGSSGGLDGHTFNIYYDGAAPHVYVDSTDFGVISFVSDRRIKRMITDNAAGALARIMALRPVTYHFANVGLIQDDGKERVGFIADEVEQIIPSAVNGEVDAIQQDGITPQPQSLNVMPIIAELTSAVQELKAIVDAQAARIAALEAA